MTDTEFEQRLEQMLESYAGRPADAVRSWREFSALRTRAAHDRRRRLAVAVTAAAVVLVAAAVPVITHQLGSKPPGNGGHRSAHPRQAGSGRITITARIGVPGAGNAPGDTGMAGVLASQRGDVWAFAYSHDLIRIDPRTNRVTWNEHIPAASDLAAGAGAIWVITTAPTVNAPHGQLLEIDPATGHLVTTFPLPRRCDQVIASGTRLWLACGNRATSFIRVDPVTGRSLATCGPVYGVSDVTATPEGIWYSGRSGVSGFVGTDARLTWVNASDPAGLVDTDSLVYADGSLWAFDGGENVARISPVTGRIVKLYDAARYDPADDLSLNFLAVDRTSIWFLRAAGYQATGVLRVSLATGRPIGQVDGVGSCGEPCWQIYLAQGSIWVPTQRQIIRIDPVRIDPVRPPDRS